MRLIKRKLKRQFKEKTLRIPISKFFIYKIFY